MMRIPLPDVMKYTLRQLLVAFDAYLLEAWDHTTTVHTTLRNLSEQVAVLGSKKRARFKDFYTLHPFRLKRRTITSENVESLKRFV